MLSLKVINSTVDHRKTLQDEYYEMLCQLQCKVRI